MKEQYHRRIITQKKLKWCKHTVDNLHLSSAEAVKELANLKKQHDKKTISNIELASKVEAQEQTIENFEWTAAELTTQIKSASETTNQQPEPECCQTGSPTHLLPGEHRCGHAHRLTAQVHLGAAHVVHLSWRGDDGGGCRERAEVTHGNHHQTCPIRLRGMF